MAEHRISSLDGARAVSIALVIVAHLNLGRHVPGLWRLDMGNLGVRVFFVISGFIITTLLLAELNRTGSVSLPGFYRRRAFRILPAYYAFLGAVIILSAFRGGDASLGKAWPAATFLVDYMNVPLTLGHAWSLSVEEQFYLLWPSAMVLLGLRRSYVGCLAILVAAPLFRVMADLGVWPTSSRYAFECVADALAVGCLLAVLRDRLWGNAMYRRFVSSPLALIPLLSVLLLIAVEQNHGLVYDAIALPALNLGIAVTLDRYMRMPQSAVGRFLNAGPVVWVGLISYSLYLWQQPFAWAPLPTMLKLPLMVGCAAVSYYAIEKPFQELRRWIESRATLAVPKQTSAI